MVEIWQDELGTEWELVSVDLEELGGPCLVRQCRSRTDYLDGDAREGVEVIGRFEDAEAARGFLLEEGFSRR